MNDFSEKLVSLYSDLGMDDPTPQLRALERAMRPAQEAMQTAKRLVEGAPMAETDWPAVPDATREAQAHEIRREVYEEFAQKEGDVLDALNKREELLSRQIEAAQEALSSMEGEAGRDRVEMARLLFTTRRRYVQRFQRALLMTGSAPEVPAPAEPKGAAHDRTVSIGRALVQHRKQNDGALPDTDSDGRPFYGSKEGFKDWAGEVIGRGASTAYNALCETGCYRADRMDDTQSVEQVVSAVMDYARRHRDRLKNGVEKF